MAALGESTEKLGVQALLELLEETQAQATTNQTTLFKMLKGHQDSLAEIQDSLAPLVPRLKQEQDLSLLLADVRNAITDAAQITQSQNEDVLRRLDDALHPPVPLVLPWWSWGRWGKTVVGLVVLAGLNVSVYLWGYRPEQRYADLARMVDGVLTQDYASLPASTRDRLAHLYQQLGFASPGQRQKGAAR